VFLFLVAVCWLTAGCLLFKVAAFKIIPGFKVVAFLLQLFWVDKVSLFVSKHFLQQQTVTSFNANSF